MIDVLQVTTRRSVNCVEHEPPGSYLDNDIFLLHSTIWKKYKNL